MRWVNSEAYAIKKECARPYSGGGSTDCENTLYPNILSSLWMPLASSHENRPTWEIWGKKVQTWRRHEHRQITQYLSGDTTVYFTILLQKVFYGQTQSHIFFVVVTAKSCRTSNTCSASVVHVSVSIAAYGWLNIKSDVWKCCRFLFP